MAETNRVGVPEFDAMFEAVKNWGRWGPDDELGTLNYITPEKVRRGRAARAQRAARVSMAIPINKVGRAGQPEPGRPPHVLMHDLPVERERAVASACASSAWPATATATPTSTR